MKRRESSSDPGQCIYTVECAKALGWERLGLLEEQKEGHMTGVLRPRGSVEDTRAGT